MSSHAGFEAYTLFPGRVVLMAKEGAIEGGPYPLCVRAGDRLSCDAAGQVFLNSDPVDAWCVKTRPLDRELRARGAPEDVVRRDDSDPEKQRWLAWLAMAADELPFSVVATVVVR